VPLQQLRPLLLAPCLVLLTSPLLAADDIRVAPGSVEDQRFSDPRFGGMSIELRLSGAGLADVKALRPRVKSAKDDRGAALYKPKDDKVPDFEEFSPDRRPGPRVNLSSPGRDASSVEVAGELELFIPARDPNTKQKFEKFLSRLDKPISSSALKASRIEVTPLSAAAYKARQQANRPTKEQITAEGKKHGASDAEIKQAIAMIEALASLGGEEPVETSVLIETKDPDGKIISIDVVGADGKELHAPSRGSSGGNDNKLLKIDLSEKPPADAGLLVTVRTAKSVVAIPMNFKEVALP